MSFINYHGINNLYTSNILHLYVNFAKLVLEELAAGRHHHFVHIDVVVLGVGKKIKNIEIF